MAAPKLENATARIETAVALAGLLHRAEHNELSVSADQYRRLVEELKTALEDDLPRKALDMILDAFPDVAELYENMHYASSGLSRAPLDRLVASETMARQVLHRVATKARST
jgi:hypothetical protein